MNILLINHYAGSVNHGMEYRPYYFAKEWIKKGHNVTIVASSFSHFMVKQPDIVKKISKEIIDNINYIWIKTPLYHGNGFKRFINILSFVFSLFRNSKYFSQKINPDIVIASSTYPLDIFPANRIAKISNAKLIYEVHDLWPLSLIELGGMSKYHPVIMLFQTAENFAYKNSNKVVSILPKTISHMQKHGMDINKFEYIPNGINLEEWSNNDKSSNSQIEKITKLKRQNKFLIAYAGAHGVANSLDSFVNASVYIHDYPIHLLLIGKGPEKNRLSRIVENNKYDNIDFLDPVTKNDIPKILTSMNVLFISLQNQSIFRFGISPNKLLDYMMAGKPIIQAINAGNDIVSEAGCGLTIEPENSKSIADAMIKLFQMTEKERHNLGNAGRSYVIKNHDYKVLAEKFLLVMK